METVAIEDAERLLDINEIARLLCVHKDTVHAMITEKRFPPPLMLGDRSPRWTVREYNAWVHELREKQVAEFEAELMKKRRGRRARA